MGVLMEDDREGLVAAAAVHPDVVHVVPRDEQAVDLDRPALELRHERLERAIARKDDNDRRHGGRRHLRAQDAAERLAKTFELDGDVPERIAAHVADDDEIGTIETAPFGRARRRGHDAHEKKQQRADWTTAAPPQTRTHVGLQLPGSRLLTRDAHATAVQPERRGVAELSR